jgi:hypothetical protein
VCISADPVNQFYGDKVTVTADLIGLSVASYQWLRNDKALSTSEYPAYDGLSTNKLTISSFTCDYEGKYQCALSFSGREVVKSNHIDLTLGKLVLTTPSLVQVSLGGIVHFENVTIEVIFTFLWL